MIRLGIRDKRTAFSPGETIEGAALWELGKAPAKAWVRLMWFTKGKGSTDESTVELQELSNPLPGDTRPFQFIIPASPYSFSGKLISLIWAVELVIEPGDHSERIEITVAPNGIEVQLPVIEQPQLMKLKLKPTR